MSRIQRKFSELMKAGEAALIPFITAGDPDLQTTLRIMRALDAGGADCIELGVPFSEPAADGQTIQRASEPELKNHITVCQVLHMFAQFRSGSKIPVIIFCFDNPFFRFGLKDFCRKT